MKIFRTLFVLLVIVVVVVAIGFYQGWFLISGSNGDSGNRKVDVNLTVDGNKIQADAEAVKDKVEELTGKAKDAAEDPKQ